MRGISTESRAKLSNSRATSSATNRGPHPRGSAFALMYSTRSSLVRRRMAFRASRCGPHFCFRKPSATPHRHSGSRHDRTRSRAPRRQGREIALPEARDLDRDQVERRRCSVRARLVNRQKATRELSRVTFDTNCRGAPVPFAVPLTNTDASWFRKRSWPRRRLRLNYLCVSSLGMVFPVLSPVQAGLFLFVRLTMPLARAARNDFAARRRCWRARVRPAPSPTPQGAAVAVSKNKVRSAPGLPRATGRGLLRGVPNCPLFNRAGLCPRT